MGIPGEYYPASPLCCEEPIPSGAGPGSPSGAGVGGEWAGITQYGVGGGDGSWYHPPGPVSPCRASLYQDPRKCRLSANIGEISVNLL